MVSNHMQSFVSDSVLPDAIPPSNKIQDVAYAFDNDRMTCALTEGTDINIKSGQENTIPIGVPLFLQKTYHMIDTCDPDIASWSNDGKTFVIKDTEKLASDIIPQFFKHNKFSSFVRQLNFYGFRKTKLDPINVNITEEEETKFWRFRHENFQRGRPDLLKEIRKPSQNNVEREEVDVLKREVKELKSGISEMSQTIARLTSLLEASLQGKRPAPCPSEEKAHKERKIETMAVPPSAFFNVESPIPSNVVSMHFDLKKASDEDLLVEDTVPEIDHNTDTLQSAQSPDRLRSVSSIPRLGNESRGATFTARSA